MSYPASIQGALPELLTAWDALTAAAAAQGITFRIADFGGLRTQADTTLIETYRQNDYNAAVASGAIAPDTTLQQFRPIAPWGHSFHNYGAAFDIDPVSDPGSYDQAVQTLGSLAPSCGLKWGGNFSNPDLPHFELDVSLAAAEQMWANWQASGGTNDSLTTVQQIAVTAQDPYTWALVATVAYSAYVVWRAVHPKRGSGHAFA